MSEVNNMKEVKAVLHEYRVEDIQIPYLLAEAVEYLLGKNDRLQEALCELVNAKDAVDESDASEIVKLTDGTRREMAAWLKARTALKEASDE